MDTRIQKLVDWTEAEVAEQAGMLQTKYRSQPDIAIRAFYPRLYAIQEEHGVYGFAPGDAGGLNFLHFQALCPANFLDIHSKYNGEQDFKKKHGLLPNELAEEIANNRALAMYNGDPFELGNSDIELLSPLLDEEILGDGRLQLGQIRTKAFNQWISLGRSDEHEEIGRQIYKDHFSSCPPNQIERVLKELRIFGVGENSDAHRVLKNVVSGRLGSIGCLREEIADQLVSTIGKAPNIVEQAQLLNFVKDAICAPITAARGGLYRSTPRQQQQEEIFRSKWVKDSLFDLLDLNDLIHRDVLSSGMATMLITSGDAKALPADLNYDLFKSYSEEGCYKILYDGIQDAVTMAAKNLDQSSIHEVLDKASKQYNVIMQGLSMYDKGKEKLYINDTISPFLSELLGVSIGQVESLGRIIRLIVPIPGVRLAHTVFRSNKILGKTHPR
jgi:hypothetical protein